MSVDAPPPSDSNEPNQARGPEIVQPTNFYDELRRELARANSTVDLIQLSPHTPTYGEFRHHTDQVRNIVVTGGVNGQEIAVRRMVGIESIEKMNWVLGSMKGVVKKTSFSIRLIDKSCKTLCQKPKTPLPRNVQIIDSRVVFEVDPVRGFHSEDEWGGRSIIHRNERYADIMVDYYNRWWKMCALIKDPMEGINEELLRDTIDRFRKRSAPALRTRAHRLLDELMEEYTS